MNTMKNLRHYIILFVSIASFVSVEGQTVSVRNNLLYDATLSPNLSIDFKIDSLWVLGISAGINAWDIDKAKNKKWRHVMVSPYVRYYTDSLYHKRFFGIHGVYSHYNASGISFPFNFYPSLKHHRRQGDLLALGGSYGYGWRLSDRWNLEAEIGLAIGYTWYKEYECQHCGSYEGKDNKVLLLPKFGLNIVYLIE